MIKKSLFAAAGFLILHGVFVCLTPPRKPVPQHMWQGNVIRAQRFIYEAGKQPENVILGSSLSARLVMEKLPDTYNLSFDGLGILDGLDVLLLSGKRPKRVFIEVNVVLREEDVNFGASLHQPVLYRLRKWFPSLREEHQPVGFLARAANQPVALLLRALRGSTKQLSPEAGDRNERGDGSLFAKVLAIQVETFSKTPSKALINEQFKRLKTGVRTLKEGGSTVVFFEMPIHAKLADSPLMRAVRENFDAHFPPAEYRYIARADSAQYQTTDGAHLGHEEALRFTEYFKSAIGKDLP